jgi:hypothetical protein
VRPSSSLLVVALTAAILTPIASPALGQSLSDAIAEVRRNNAQKQARNRVRGAQTKILQTLMYTDVSVDFDKTPSRDAFEFLRTVLDINMIVRFSDDPVGHGIDPRTPISLKLQRVPTVEALELVLEQCSLLEECTWQLRRGFLEVGTKERLSAPAARELRMYPIDELLFEAPRFDNAPLAGFSYGYPGWVGGYDGYPDGWEVNYPYTWGGGYGGGGGYSGSISAGPRAATGGTVTTAGPWLNSPEAKADRADELVDFIVGMVEPDAWRRNGGEWATIEYREGTLIVRAPDFVHRQLDGYPPVPPPQAPPPASGP